MKDTNGMLKKLACNQAGHSPSHWPVWFVLSAGCILAFAGASQVLDVFGKSQIWDLSAPLLGMPFRYLFISIGLGELTVAWLCLCTNKRAMGLGLMLWLIANYAGYRAGLWAMGWAHPWIFIGKLAETFQISPFLADGVITVVLAYLLVGGLAALWQERKGKRLRQLNFSPDFLKISCLTCDGHIEFPANILGQKIPCPHCRAEITLRAPA